MTQDADMNRYFLAAYSALCGNVNVLKSVCSTWEDLIWAYTMCLVDTNVELQFREILVPPLSKLPAFYWDNKREIESVFDAVNATKLNEDNLKGAKIFHEVQKLLIINDIPNVLNVVDEWSKSATTNEHEILRFFAHMVIMLKRLDKTSVGSQGKILYNFIYNITVKNVDFSTLFSKKNA